jgi:hypothetical protein
MKHIALLLALTVTSLQADDWTPEAGFTSLFNGKDLTGWCFRAKVKKEVTTPGEILEKHDGKTEAKDAGNYSAKDGVFTVTFPDEPDKLTGQIYTVAEFPKNFILKLQWRFPADKDPGNSGVLVRQIGEDKVWPKSVEAQLHSGNAGDFWNIENFTMTTDPARTKGRNTKKTHFAERPLGEWNEYEIIVDKGLVALNVNGEEVNRATEVEEVAGHIALQSEGAEIHFKNIRLIPLAD